MQTFMIYITSMLLTMFIMAFMNVFIFKHPGFIKSMFSLDTICLSFGNVIGTYFFDNFIVSLMIALFFGFIGSILDKIYNNNKEIKI